MTGVSRNSVAKYIRSYIVLGSKLEDILELTNRELEELSHPDWNEINEELRVKKGSWNIRYFG